MSKRIKNTTGQMYYLNAVEKGKLAKAILHPNAELSITDESLEIFQKAPGTKGLFGSIIEVVGQEPPPPVPVPKPKIKPKAKTKTVDPVNG